jgi:hypothetical protein
MSSYWLGRAALILRRSIHQSSGTTIKAPGNRRIATRYKTLFRSRRNAIAITGLQGRDSASGIATTAEPGATDGAAAPEEMALTGNIGDTTNRIPGRFMAVSVLAFCAYSGSRQSPARPWPL